MDDEDLIYQEIVELKEDISEQIEQLQWTTRGINSILSAISRKLTFIAVALVVIALILVFT